MNRHHFSCSFRISWAKKLWMQKVQLLYMKNKPYKGSNTWTPCSDVIEMTSHDYIYQPPLAYYPLPYVICYISTLSFPKWKPLHEYPLEVVCSWKPTWTYFPIMKSDTTICTTNFHMECWDKIPNYMAVFENLMKRRLYLTTFLHQTIFTSHSDLHFSNK